MVPVTTIKTTSKASAKQVAASAWSSMANKQKPVFKFLLWRGFKPEHDFLSTTESHNIALIKHKHHTLKIISFHDPLTMSHIGFPYILVQAHH